MGGHLKALASELYLEMCRLVRLYAAIPTTAEDLPEISLVEENQLPDEGLGIGDNIWATLTEVEQEHDTKPFFKSVRKF